MNKIDSLLNKVTMYRLVLYVLAAYILVALGLSVFGLTAFSPQSLVFSTAMFLVACVASNWVAARWMKAETNLESAYITALILACIVSPAPSGTSIASTLTIIIASSILAMATKFMLAWKMKHIFNPAGIAVLLCALLVGQSASWWIGTTYMLPAVAIGGLLVTRKLRRFDLVLAFLFVGAISIVLIGRMPLDPEIIVSRIFLESPIIFFATIMLTEPLTMPPDRTRRVIYGAFTGLIFSPMAHVGPVYSTPELALSLGNILSWLVSPKAKHVMTFVSKTEIAKDTDELVFSPTPAISFKPGQYLEWTIGHDKTDSRGSRRFFTISSSPTDKFVKIGVKFDWHGSSLKNALSELKEGDDIVAGNLAGDFTMPVDPSKKLCFMAGGIGITPFASMLRYMIDTGEKRDTVLMYSVKTADEIAYKPLLDEAKNKLALKTEVSLTDKASIPSDWKGRTGFIDAAMIEASVPEMSERTFYISGPHAFVVAEERALRSIGIPSSQIHTDYFPGF